MNLSKALYPSKLFTLLLCANMWYMHEVTEWMCISYDRSVCIHFIIK